MKRFTGSKFMGATMLLLVMQGCTTTYVGRKLAADASLSAGDTGMPHMLTRHEYTLKVTADANDATKPVYALVRTSVPDPHQRYSIALDPALFTDGTITLTYGSMGNLSASDVTGTSQVVATLKAVTMLASEVIGAKSLRDESGVWWRFTESFRKPALVCPAAGTVVGFLDQLAVMYADSVKGLSATAEEKNSKATWVAQRFHFRNDAERQCGIEAVKILKQQAGNIDDSEFKNAMDAAEKSVALGPAGDDARAWIKELRDAFGTSDLATLERSQKALPATASLEIKSAYSEALAYLRSVETLELAVDLAQFYVHMPRQVWQARHLANVETELETIKLRLFLLQPIAAGTSLTTQQQSEKAKLLARRDQLDSVRSLLIDQVALQERIAAIDGQLKAGRYGDGEGRSLLSVERDRLQGVFEQARADTLSKDQTYDLIQKAKAKKVVAREDIPVSQQSMAWIDEKNKKPITDPKLPKYVLVLEPVPSPAPIQPKTQGQSLNQGATK